MSSGLNRSETDLGDRERRVREVVDEWRSRRVGNSAADQEELLSKHAELLPELAEELRRLALIDGARRLNGAADATLLVIRCPQCRQTLEVADAGSLAEVSCGTCGISVQLVLDDEAGSLPNRLGR